jgi:hypothetical protein
MREADHEAKLLPNTTAILSGCVGRGSDRDRLECDRPGGVTSVPEFPSGECIRHGRHIMDLMTLPFEFGMLRLVL